MMNKNRVIDRLFDKLMARKVAEKENRKKEKIQYKKLAARAEVVNNRLYKKHQRPTRITAPKGVATDSKIIIDLSGPDSDAFYLLKFAKKYASQFQLNWNAIHDEMTSGDYDNLIKVFEKHFGEFVTLIKFK